MADVQRLLNGICSACCDVLGNNLTGIYIHGSLAFGCFAWERSDVDFLIVVRHRLSIHEKTALLQALLAQEADIPPKGIEMSVVLEKDCRAFKHPMHYELHYSNAHRDAYCRDAVAYCERMQGNDPDLAAHCTVIRAVGYALYGAPVSEVFSMVPVAAYIDSLWYDIASARVDIHDNPVYVILNLCRVLAYLTDGAILSKRQGGEWGIGHLPSKWSPLLGAALEEYAGQKKCVCDEGELSAFADFMLREIEAHTLRHA